MRASVVILSIPALLALSAAAHADVVISSGTTANMSCAGGICAPTAKNGVLNVTDLQNLLASGNVEVTTTSSGVQAGDIKIDTPFAWSSSNILTLDAYQSIRVDKPVSVTGQGGLTITTNDGGKNGYFGFGAKGNVTFANLSNALSINGGSYTLVRDIATLAADVAADPSGNYAFASDYDASGDGTYQNSAIPTEFYGNFEGLGNTISNLSLNGTGDVNARVGFFAEISNDGQSGGTIENISLKRETVEGDGFTVGGLTGLNLGTINASHVSGSLISGFKNGGPDIGGLAGYNVGTVARSSASVTITADAEASAAGLVGGSEGSIVESFAVCNASSGGEAFYGGGLAGYNYGSIVQSYAAGNVTIANGVIAGGLLGTGNDKSTITQSYSTTTLKHAGHKNPDVGGLIGVDHSPAGSNASTYWNLTTSKIRKRRDGAGTPYADPGITGLTTAQLQAGLPKGFDPTVWAENPKINSGFPYLIDNPPQK